MIFEEVSPMKKLLALIFALLMLCACNVQEEPVDENPGGGIKIENSVSYLGENGKHGFHSEGVPITEAEFDAILKLDGYLGDFSEFIYTGAHEEGALEEFYVGIKIDGTRKAVGFEWDKGTFYTEEKNHLHWVYSSGQKAFINEIPFEEFNILAPNGFGNGRPFMVISGSNGGDYYEYAKNSEGEWELYYKESGGVYSENYGLYFTKQYYNGWFYGAEDSEGNVVVEPIYSLVDPVLADRLLVYSGFSGYAYEDDVAKTYIMDFSGNVICDDYIYIKYGVPERQKYVLAAGGFDEEGNHGWWFIDGDGNKLSERFESIRFISEYMTDEEGLGGNYQSKAEVTKDGETEIILTEDYACSYNVSD